MSGTGTLRERKDKKNEQSTTALNNPEEKHYGSLVLLRNSVFEFPAIRNISYSILTSFSH